MVLLILATELIVWGRACESRVELKHYPIPYFNHIAVFEAPYHQTGRVHTCFIDTQISNVSSKCVWAPPLREFSDAALNAAKYTMEWSLISTLDCHIRVCAIPIVTQVALRPPDLASSQYTSKPSGSCCLATTVQPCLYLPSGFSRNPQVKQFWKTSMQAALGLVPTMHLSRSILGSLLSSGWTLCYHQFYFHVLKVFIFSQFALPCSTTVLATKEKFWVFYTLLTSWTVHRRAEFTVH